MKNIKKTLEQFKKEVKDLIGDEYSVTGNEYKNNQTKILMKHNTCGHIYEVTPAHFLGGRRCPLHGSNVKLTTEDFKKKVYSLVGDEYSVLGEYINCHEKILMKHNICEHEYNVEPNKFLQNRRCPFCAKNSLKTTEQFKKELFDLVGDEYILLSEYKSCKTKVLLKHNKSKCNHKYEVTPNDFLNGYRCPFCCESKGEKEISLFLKNNNIEFKTQKRFSDCKDKYTLPFDFFIEKYNILIEYDGEQHEKPIQFRGISIEEAIEHFKETLKHDEIKNNYCSNKNINLFRIKYNENINEKLQTIFKEIL